MSCGSGCEQIKKGTSTVLVDCEGRGGREDICDDAFVNEFSVTKFVSSGDRLPMSLLDAIKCGEKNHLGV